jgi:hypothetical protein
MLSVKHFVCCSIDVHKKFVVATIAVTDYRGVTSYIQKRSATFNSDLKALKKWLLDHNCTEVCMESTGKYWIPIFHILEDSCHVVVANPKYVRAIKGQKTDDRDSAWIADLFKFDIVPSSYIPCKEIRALRELFRYRQKLVGHRSSEKNRFQNALTVSNIALSSVLTDTFGKSATAIVDYILTCDVFDPEHCKSLLFKKAKDKADDVVKSIIVYKLCGGQSLKMKVCWKHLGYINECVGTLDEAITDLSKPYHKFIELATTTPGITEKSASFIIAEIGVDMAVINYPGASTQALCSAPTSPLTALAFCSC